MREAVERATRARVSIMVSEREIKEVKGSQAPSRKVINSEAQMAVRP